VQLVTLTTRNGGTAASARGGKTTVTWMYMCVCVCIDAFVRLLLKHKREPMYKSRRNTTCVAGCDLRFLLVC